MGALINIIIFEVKLSFDLVLAPSRATMQDLRMSQLFGIPLKTSNPHIPRVSHWLPPDSGWVKINCDGSSFGPYPNGSICFVIRESHASFLGAMVQNIGYASSLEAEFCACMLALEKAMELQLTQVWIETDSLLVVKAFHTSTGIPWRLINRWKNCVWFFRNISCKFNHVLRDSNLVADALAKNGQGLAFNSFRWWDYPPSFV